MLMATKRDKQLHVLLSDEEERMLEAVADRRGLTSSDWIRQTIRQAYESDPAFQQGSRRARR